MNGWSFLPELVLGSFFTKHGRPASVYFSESCFKGADSRLPCWFPSLSRGRRIQLFSLVLFSETVNVTSFYSSSWISFPNSAQSVRPSGLLWSPGCLCKASLSINPVAASIPLGPIFPSSITHCCVLQLTNELVKISTHTKRSFLLPVDVWWKIWLHNLGSVSYKQMPGPVLLVIHPDKGICWFVTIHNS